MTAFIAELTASLIIDLIDFLETSVYLERGNLSPRLYVFFSSKAENSRLPRINTPFAVAGFRVDCVQNLASSVFFALASVLAREEGLVDGWCYVAFASSGAGMSWLLQLKYSLAQAAPIFTNSAISYSSFGFRIADLENPTGLRLLACEEA